MIKHVSFAIRLKDELTNAPPALAAGVTFLLDGCAFMPVRKSDGWFVFVNVQAGTHDLEIQSGWFLPEQLQIEVPHWKTPGIEQWVVLRHSTAYPMPPGGGHTVGTLLSRVGKPVETQLIFTFGRDAIKLLQEQTVAGDRELRLFLPRKSLLAEIPGRFFLEDGEQSELCTILEETDGLFRLGAPLRFPHKRGAALWLARLVSTDGQGRFSAAYPGGEEPRVFAVHGDGFQLLSIPPQTEGEVLLMLA